MCDRWRRSSALPSTAHVGQHRRGRGALWRLQSGRWKRPSLIALLEILAEPLAQHGVRSTAERPEPAEPRPTHRGCVSFPRGLPYWTSPTPPLRRFTEHPERVSDNYRPPRSTCCAIVTVANAPNYGSVQGIRSIEMISPRTMTSTEGWPATLKLGGSMLTSVATSARIPSVALP